MRKLLILVLPSIIVGCATAPRPTPAPVMLPPPEKCITVPGEGCKKISAGNVGGTTLGHHNNSDLPAKAATVSP